MIRIIAVRQQIDDDKYSAKSKTSCNSSCIDLIESSELTFDLKQTEKK